MKLPILRKTAALFLGVAVLSAPLTISSTSAFAKKDTVTRKDGKHQNPKTKKVHQAKTSEKRKEITTEAVDAIRETEKALKALDGNKKKAALAALERAVGKLEIILARDPKLALSPVGVNAVVYDVMADIDAVKALKKRAIAALKDGRLQEARHMIRDLASETVISVTNIPLATYPLAIKSAAKLIGEGKTKEGRAALEAALSTLVITETIIPLPVTTAQTLLADAEKLGEKKDRSSKENKKLEELLTLARRELKFAEVLGYGSKETFKGFYEEITKISEKTSDGKSGTGLFAKIKGYLGDALSFSQKK